MSTVAAVLFGKERRMVAAFEAHGAISRDTALTLEQLGVARGVILRRLRERAVVREADHDRYYLDRQSWDAVRRSRRRAIHVAAVIALALLLAVIFGTRRAWAGEEQVRLSSISRGDRPADDPCRRGTETA